MLSFPIKSLRDKNFIFQAKRKSKRKKHFIVMKLYRTANVWVCVLLCRQAGIYCCWNCWDLCACCVVFSRFATIKRTEHFSFETHLLWFSSMRTWERCGRAKILRGTIVNYKKKTATTHKLVKIINKFYTPPINYLITFYECN